MAVPFISLRPPRRRRVDGRRASSGAGPADDAVVTFENRYRTRAGDYRWLNWTVVGRAGVMHFVAKDVTATAKRRRGRAAHPPPHALHRTLTANLPDTSVFLLDHDLRILIADGEAIRASAWLDAALFRGRLVAELYAEVPDAGARALASTATAPR